VLPKDGGGAHPRILGSGWHKDWESLKNPERSNEPVVPSTNQELLTQLSDPLHCDAPTWGGDNDTLPINCVNWYVAFAFCAFDGGRLPTEAEWNYAAAFGDAERPYPWSTSTSDTSIDETRAAYLKVPALERPTPVGSHPAGQGGFARDSKQGNEDLAGNVAEWALDQWLAEPPTSCEADCMTAWTDDRRVIRGGAYTSGPKLLRSGVRVDDSATTISGMIGFRCAHDDTTTTP
jgi:formylglycine-generating enzyme required for sulfatase activity